MGAYGRPWELVRIRELEPCSLAWEHCRAAFSVEVAEVCVLVGEAGACKRAWLARYKSVSWGACKRAWLGLQGPCRLALGLALCRLAWLELWEHCIWEVVLVLWVLVPCKFALEVDLGACRLLEAASACRMVGLASVSKALSVHGRRA